MKNMATDKYLLNNKSYGFPTDTFLNYIEYSLPTPISGLWHEYGRLLVNLIPGTGPFNKTKQYCSHHHHKLCNMTKTPNNLFKKYVVKRTPFLCDIHDNKVNIVKYPKQFKNKSVIIEENEIKDIDIIICATGYKMKFDFLDEKYYKTKLIKKMVPNNDNSIAFIGFTRPTMGSLINIAEMQSWWVSLYFQNKLKYEIRNYKWARFQDPLNIKNDHINTIVIGNYYFKDLALDMKINPNLVKLFFTNFNLWVHIMTNSIHPTIYRLNGHFKHKNAEKILYYMYPSFKERLNDKYSNKKYTILYYFMFVLFHIIFIMSIFLFTKFVLLKHKRLKKRWILFSILFVLYSYNNWH
jgi:hypothetical protein